MTLQEQTSGMSDARRHVLIHRCNDLKYREGFIAGLWVLERCSHAEGYGHMMRPLRDEIERIMEELNDSSRAS